MVSRHPAARYTQGKSEICHRFLSGQGPRQGQQIRANRGKLLQVRAPTGGLPPLGPAGQKLDQHDERKTRKKDPQKPHNR